MCDYKFYLFIYFKALTGIWRKSTLFPSKKRKKKKQSRQPDAQITLGLYGGGGSSLLSYYLYCLCKSPAS